jgi:pimeloyl-ACP methyl ester carboxylesterase
MVWFHWGSADISGEADMKGNWKIVGAVLGLLALVVVGLYFLLKRPDIDHAALDAKYSSPQSRWLDIGDGVSIHYRIEGTPEGRTLLLVHGFSASLHTWEPWVALLGGKYRVVSLDLPGHGLTRTPAGYAPSPESYADAVESFAQKLGLGRVIYAGNSMGGGVGWQMALRHPARLDGLVLVDAAGWPDPRIDPQNTPVVFKLLASPVWGPLIRDLDASALTAQGLRASFVDPTKVTPDMIARYVELSRAPNHREVLLEISSGRAARQPATPELMAQITTPTLVLHGERDNLIPVDSGKRFAETIPGAKLILYPDVGHIPQEEISEKSAADLDAWIATLPASPQGAPLAAPAAAPSAEKKKLDGVY